MSLNEAAFYIDFFRHNRICPNQNAEKNFSFDNDLIIARFEKGSGLVKISAHI